MKGRSFHGGWDEEGHHEGISDWVGEDVVKRIKRLFTSEGVDRKTHVRFVGIYGTPEGVFLGREFVETGEVPHNFFTHLRTAFSLRQTADYSFVRDMTEEDARENIGSAGEFLNFTVDYLCEKALLEG